MCSFYCVVLRYFELFFVLLLLLSVFHPAHCNNDWFQFNWPLKSSFNQPTSDPPNEVKCQNLEKSALLKMLKDEGHYNPSYMASTKEEAANFPDLADKHFVRAAEKSTCDADCMQKTDSFLALIKENGKLPPMEKIAPYRPDLSNKNEALKPSDSMLNFALLNSQTRNLNNFNTRRNPVSQATSPMDWGFNSAFRTRWKRQANKMNHKKPKNDLDSIGTSYPLYCWKDGDEDENGLYMLCRACKSIREMPDRYFPPYLNEVRCDGTDCLGKEGSCVQKYVTMDILKNNGTDDCQQWVKVSISISVCCDCQLKITSVLSALVKRKT